MINIKKIRPVFNCILTTMDTYTEDELKVGGIIDSSKIQMSIKEYQTVLAVGSTARAVKVGDIVKINPERYKVRKYREDSIKNDINPIEVINNILITNANKYDISIANIFNRFNCGKECKNKNPTAIPITIYIANAIA